MLLPQKPLPVRGDAVAEADWLATQEGRFGGAATDVLDALGLFDIFHARWFATLLAITVISTGAYVISRFPGTWRTITKPRVRVPDRYFDMAPNRASVDAAIDPDRLEATLRSRRYGVQRVEEDGVTYMFADRFQWAALGNLLTHVAVIVFIVAAVVSRAEAFSSPLFLSEGGTLPVFPVSNPNQIQVELVDAVARFSPEGIPLDYRSDMVIYRRGEEVKRCESTVNSPCSYDGYRLYQSAYFGFGAALVVRDATTGNVLYRETVALSEKAAAPHLRVEDASGGVLYDAPVVMADAARAGEQAYAAALLELEGDHTLTVWLPIGGDGGDNIVVFEPGAEGSAAAQLAPGESAESAGLTVSYLSMETVPAGVIDDSAAPGGGRPGRFRRGIPADEQRCLRHRPHVRRRRGRRRCRERSAGADRDRPRRRRRPTGARASPPRSAISSTRFEGQREFSGITVRRDRSDYLVWAGAAMIVAGLMITFWVPRRRLWARISTAKASLAGQAPGHANYSREMQRLLEAASEPVTTADNPTQEKV